MKVLLDLFCSRIELITEPKSKAAFIWILGEYCSIIENPDLIIDQFLDSFSDENPEVQLQLLTSTVKIYLQSPQTCQDQIQFILNEATKETSLPDVRNRALIYWRSLSLEITQAQSIISVHKDQIDFSEFRYDDQVLNELLSNIGLASGVLHFGTSSFNVSSSSASSEKGKHFESVEVFKGPDCIEIEIAWFPTHALLRLSNITYDPLFNFALALSPNQFGIDMISSPEFPEHLNTDSSSEVSFKFGINPNKVSQQELEFALQTNLGVIFFRSKFSCHKLFLTGFRLKRVSFLEKWKARTDTHVFEIDNALILSDEELRMRKICVVARNEREVCVAFSLPGNLIYLLDIELEVMMVKCTLVGDPQYFTLIELGFQSSFTSNST